MNNPSYLAFKKSYFSAQRRNRKKYEASYGLVGWKMMINQCQKPHFLHIFIMPLFILAQLIGDRLIPLGPLS